MCPFKDEKTEENTFLFPSRDARGQYAFFRMKQ